MRKILGILIILILVSMAGFIFWGLTPQKPSAEVNQYLSSEGSVTVRNDKWLVFIPEENPENTGFIIYPGGHVDFRAYAPIAFQLAEKGILVVIVPMPLNLAVMDPEAAEAVIAGYPSIDKWAIGGHSLGGAMAANYTYKYPDEISGLVLWGAYPAESNDLSNFGIPVISISGSLDGLATPEKITSSRNLLPPDTEFLEINGGNHSQMGWYGDQRGDLEAGITREEQQEELLAATWAFLTGLE